MNQMLLFQLALVVTFNNVIIISTLTSMQQKFSLQTATLYPQGGQLAGYKKNCQVSVYKVIVIIVIIRNSH